MCSAEGRHATEPGTDYKTGRAELPTPILPYNSPDRRMTLPTDARTRMACPAVSFGPVRAREKGKRSWKEQRKEGKPPPPLAGPACPLPPLRIRPVRSTAPGRGPGRGLPTDGPGKSRL